MHLEDLSGLQTRWDLYLHDACGRLDLEHHATLAPLRHCTCIIVGCGCAITGCATGCAYAMGAALFAVNQASSL